LSRAARRWGAFIGGLALVLAAAVLCAASFDPNTIKPRIEKAVLDATGRAIALNGPIRIGWSLQPTIEATDVTLANLPGGTRPDIARVERIQARLSMTALFRGEIEVARLTLTGPNILFEQVDGKPNWLAGPTRPASDQPVPPEPAPGNGPQLQLRIRAIHIQNGMITWRFPTRTKVVGVRSLDLTHPVDLGPVDLAAVLVYSDFKPFDLEISAQPSGGLRAPWTTKFRFSAFDTTASAAGMVDLDGPFDLQVDAKAGALEKLNDLLPEMRLPPLHGAILSTRLRNGPALGALPVIGPTRLHVDSADLGAIIPGLALGPTELSLPDAGGAATVSSAGRFASQPFTLSGTVGIPLEPDGRVSLPIDLKAQAVPGAPNAAAGSLALRGSVALNTVRFAGLDATAALRTPALASLRPVVSPSLPALTDVRFDGRIVVPADRGSMAFKGAKLFTHEGDVAGDWTLGLNNRLAIDGKLVSSRLDLDAMLAAFGVALPPAPALAGAVGPAISTAPLPWALLRGPAMALSVQIAAMGFQGEIWKDVAFTLHLAGGRLAAAPVTLSLPDGPMRMSLTIDAASDAVPIAVDLHAPGIPLALVGRYAGLPGPMAGAVRIDAALRGAGRSPHEIAATLAGPVSATLVGGRMTNAAFTMLTAASLDALGITVPAQGDTTLRCLGLVGSFDKGVGLLRTIALDTTYLKLDGSGQVDFGNETVALKLNPMAQISGASVAVPVVVEGPFHSVRGRLDANGLDKLGLFIDGLFGGDRSTACTDAGLIPTRMPDGKAD
jgi:uncharacterized protein involved in outer membrane biogenesis